MDALWSSSASAALLSVVMLRPVRLSSRNTLLSLLPRMMEPSAVRLGAASTSSGSEIGRRWGVRRWLPGAPVHNQQLLRSQQSKQAA